MENPVYRLSEERAGEKKGSSQWGVRKGLLQDDAELTLK